MDALDNLPPDITNEVHEQCNNEQQLGSIRDDQLEQDASAMPADHNVR